MVFEQKFHEEIMEKLNLLEADLPPFAKYLESIMINLGSRFRNDLNYRDFEWAFESKELMEYCQISTGWYYLLCTNLETGIWFLKYSIGNYLGEIKTNRKTPKSKRGPCQMQDCNSRGTEWDHILPHSWGGPNEEWNFQLLCGTHNRLKSSSLTSFARKLHTDGDFQEKFNAWCEKEMA